MKGFKTVVLRGRKHRLLEVNKAVAPESINIT